MATATTITSKSLPGRDRALIAEWVLQAESSPKTKSQYRQHVLEFLAWLNTPSLHPDEYQPPALTGVSSAHVRRFVVYLRQTDRPLSPTDGRALSPSTRKNYLASLRSLYTYLLAVELVDRDPTAGIRRPRTPQEPGLVLTADELRQLLAAKAAPRARIQNYLLAYTAARSSELRALRWQDVDMSQRTIVLRGKGGKARVLPIHPRLMSELRRWLVHQEAAAERNPDLRAARTHPDTDFVLVSKTGRPISASAIFKQLNRAACAAGLHVLDPAHRECRSRVSPHVLRRTFATVLLNDGHALDAVADILGHVSLDTTRQHYAFASAERKRMTVEAFNL